MFFGNALGPALFGLLATHPPLTVRIKRIDPSFDGKFPPAEPLRTREEPEVKPTNEALERLALGGVTYEIGGEVHTPPTFAPGVDISKAAGETKGS